MLSKKTTTKKVLTFFTFLFCSTQYLLTGSLAFAENLRNEVREEFTNSPRNSDDSKYSKTFLISAYYSPLPNQIKYVTGSYEGDIRLNGDGVKAADGTEVYPGMIAAPKSYAFGTKMEIPGIGTVAVHDRGGAIVPAGERGNQHDRLDVWMGYGDVGLQRALEWGKRKIDVLVYGIDSGIQEVVNLANYTPDEKNPRPDPVGLFQETLTLGSEGEEVKKLQQYLLQMNYYSGDITGVFDEPTHEAVTQLQLDSEVISHSEDFGAGHVGPKTMKILASGISTHKTDITEMSQTIASADIFDRDLLAGDTGGEVKKLQQELVRLHFLGVEPTGFYGEVTEHAVFKFQQSQDIVEDQNSAGAGVFGPATRERLNEILSLRAQVEMEVRLEN